MITLRVLIAGAGISGLSLARALAAHGITAEVAERSTEPRTEGAGFYLPANAVRALRAIGLGDVLAGRAQLVTRQRLRDHRDKPLSQFPTGAIWGDVGDCYAISRAALHEILLGEGTPGVRLGTGIERVEADGKVTFSDGSQESYDLVVGADGIGSAVRATAFEGAGPRFLQQISWRFLTDDPTGASTPGDWTCWLGKGSGFLALPLGDGRVYCYADVNSAGPLAPAGDWRELFTHFGGPIPVLLEQGKDAYFAPLMEVGGTDWVRPHVVLIGDAAHACSPSMAQGGAMAMEDALVLAETVAGVGEREAIPAALEAYRQRRAPRVRWVLDQNHRRDKGRETAPLIRNLALRLSGEKIYRANHAGLLATP